MEFDGMTSLAHALEDMFSHIRDRGVEAREWPLIFDLAFGAVGFFNGELGKLLEKKDMDGDPSELISQLRDELEQLRRYQSGQAENKAAEPAVGAAASASASEAEPAPVFYQPAEQEPPKHATAALL
jgi:two-component system chemotaxis sensor kinase CheA